VSIKSLHIQPIYIEISTFPHAVSQVCVTFKCVCGQAVGVTVDVALSSRSHGCLSPERHPAPFVGDVVSQMFRMHGALSAWMFDGLAAKGDIW